MLSGFKFQVRLSMVHECLPESPTTVGFFCATGPLPSTLQLCVDGRHQTIMAEGCEQNQVVNKNEQGSLYLCKVLLGP